MNARQTAQVSAYHMVANLASSLYETSGQRVMELIKNGLAASMSDPTRWEPQRAKIEIRLVRNCSLSPHRDPALIVLDHGSGFTANALERYFSWIGTPLTELKRRATTGYTGISQKGIGRFAALALNENCLQEDPLKAVKHGYYLFTRTAESGDVRFVTVIPERAELEKGFDTNHFIASDAPELDEIGLVQGSFTAILIPTPIFANAEEIYESIRWFLPRERDKMFDLTINGKGIEPPPLETEVSVTWDDIQYRARLGARDEDEGGGVWLCDAETSLRVASCLNVRQLPEPLNFPDLVGDIFIPGLLRHQNTARSNLARDFMHKENPEWQKTLLFLKTQVVSPAKALVERDAIKGAAAEALDDIISMFNDVFGLPDSDLGPCMPFDDPAPSYPHHPQPKPTVPTPGPVGPKKPRKPPAYRRTKQIRVRDEAWTLYRGLSLPEFVFAQVVPDAVRMIEVNVRGNYKALPDSKLARREHCLMQILFAIGLSKSPGDPAEAIRFANEIRGDFLKK